MINTQPHLTIRKVPDIINEPLTISLNSIILNNKNKLQEPANKTINSLLQSTSNPTSSNPTSSNPTSSNPTSSNIQSNVTSTSNSNTNGLNTNSFTNSSVRTGRINTFRQFNNMTSMPWLASGSTTSNTSSFRSLTNGTPGSKTPKAKEKVILYPEFLECCNQVEDPYWQKIFENLCLGKLPRGFTISGNIISHKKKSKISKFEIITGSSNLTTNCIKFFKDVGSIRSPLDLDTENLVINDKDTKTVKTWSQIRNKSAKQSYKNIYINEMAVKYNLDNDYKDWLKTIINVGFLLGYLTNDSVIFDNNKIITIEGIMFVNNKFYIDPKYIHTKKIVNKKSVQSKKENIDNCDEEEEDTEDTNKKNYNVMKIWIKFIKNYTSQYNSVDKQEGDIINSGTGSGMSLPNSVQSTPHG